MKKKAQFLDVHMEIPIGQNRGRGQPKKTSTHTVNPKQGQPIRSTQK